MPDIWQTLNKCKLILLMNASSEAVKAFNKYVYFLYKELLLQMP